MIKNHVIHFKNILFFKILSCLMAIIVSFFLLSELREEIVALEVKQGQTENFLNNTISKLNYLLTFKQDIEKIETRYKNTLAQSEKNIELKIKKLQDKIERINKQYNLPIPIKVQTRHNRISNNIKNDDINIYYSELILEFAAKDHKELVEIIHDIVSFLPETSVVANISVRQVDYLSPRIIKMLSHNYRINLFESEVRIVNQDIIYKGVK